MDFNQIRYFLALSNTLNFTRAAEQCYVSQPALTQSIQRLEAELGGELIHRDGRNTELSPLGKSLRGHFEQIDRTRHLVRSTAKNITSGETAELNIGVMCTIGPQVLTPMLEAFQMQHPMISLVLHDVTPPSISDLATVRWTRWRILRTSWSTGFTLTLCQYVRGSYGDSVSIGAYVCCYGYRSSSSNRKSTLYRSIALRVPRGISWLCQR